MTLGCVWNVKCNTRCHRAVTSAALHSCHLYLQWRNIFVSYTQQDQFIIHDAFIIYYHIMCPYNRPNDQTKVSALEENFTILEQHTGRTRSGRNLEWHGVVTRTCTKWGREGADAENQNTCYNIKNRCRVETWNPEVFCIDTNTFQGSSKYFPDPQSSNTSQPSEQ